jgi:hypothetical protein
LRRCSAWGLHVYNRSTRLGSVDQFQADVRQLEEQLGLALGERSKLQHEIAARKRDAELTWAVERVESALFRERINDVAYEVTRITQALERPGSLIELSAYDAAPEIRQGRRTRTLHIPSLRSLISDNTARTFCLVGRSPRVYAPERSTPSKATGWHRLTSTAESTPPNAKEEAAAHPRPQHRRPPPRPERAANTRTCRPS